MKMFFKQIHACIISHINECVHQVWKELHWFFLRQFSCEWKTFDLLSLRQRRTKKFTYNFFRAMKFPLFSNFLVAREQFKVFLKCEIRSGGLNGITHPFFYCMRKHHKCESGVLFAATFLTHFLKLFKLFLSSSSRLEPSMPLLLFRRVLCIKRNCNTFHLVIDRLQSINCTRYSEERELKKGTKKWDFIVIIISWITSNMLRKNFLVFSCFILRTMKFTTAVVLFGEVKWAEKMWCWHKLVADTSYTFQNDHIFHGDNIYQHPQFITMCRIQHVWFDLIVITVAI